jgi:ABC-type iron transport system FetAB ATPase subunit
LPSATGGFTIDSTQPPALLLVQDLAFGLGGPYNLRLAAGECIGLGGASGSGKTRLLRAIADLDVHSGQILLDGVACDNVPPSAWRRKVALLPAESAWWFDNVGAHFAEAPDAGQLESLGFTAEVLSWRVDRLSSGERQRLAILRMLSVHPRVLLLDEPTANLDEENIARAESLIRSYLQGASAAAIWVSHDQRQLQRMAGRRYRLVQGRLAGEEAAA